MPLGWAGRDLRRCMITSAERSKGTGWVPPRHSCPRSVLSCTLASAVPVSTVSGSAPCRPRITALSEP